jgi:hypothetical protein
MAPARSCDRLELARAPDPRLPRERTGRRDHPRFDGVDGVSRFRPLARRRLSTRRPPWVFIRERKPWTRRRRIRLG